MGQTFTRFFILCSLFLVGSDGVRAQLAGAEQQRLADGLYARELYDLALVEYQKLLRQDPAPENVDLLAYRAGECASHINQKDVAKSLYEMSARSGDNSLPAQRSRYRLADEAYRAGRMPEAETQLRALIEQGVDSSIEAPVRFTLAQILENRNQPVEALQIYKEIMASFPGESLAAYSALRVAALAGGSLEERRGFYAQALKNPPSRDFKIEALWGLASLESQAKNHEETAKIYWQLWQEFPDSTRVRGSMIYLAWAQLQAGEYGKALALSDATSETRKAADGDTWLYLDGVCHQKLDDEAAAVNAYETLLTKYQQSRFRSVAAYEVARSYAAKLDHKKVLVYAKELQQVPGQEVEGLWLLAESARGAGDVAQALQVYTRIAHQYPQDRRASDALYFRALLLMNTGEGASASKALFDFYARYPEDPRALTALEQGGDLLVKAGQLQSGLDKWLEVIRLNPDADPALLFKIAMLEIRLEKLSDAQRHLALYLKKEVPVANLAEAHYWRGVLWDREGEDARAQTSLEAALQGDHLKPAFQSAARMRLGQSYTRNGSPEKALSAFMPLLGTDKEGELSDELLLWLIPVSAKVDNADARNKIARAMVKDTRKPATRELGFYALAEGLAAEGEIAEAKKAWEQGLTFQSKTLEAVEAHLAYADFLLAQKEFALARTHYSETARLASGMEQGRLQALGMMGSGRVYQAEGNWEEAAKYFMSVAVLFDDPALSPEALQFAAEAFRRSGQEAKALAAEKELNTRYPPAADVTP
ncbi:tetratricopeptide repeat protein [Kiritimatiellaeota bacterium B1221]|nr:tetratricopeptide repeat protein [Kiritimatiellaeota bacterium B1221]